MLIKSDMTIVSSNLCPIVTASKCSLFFKLTAHVLESESGHRLKIY